MENLLPQGHSDYFDALLLRLCYIYFHIRLERLKNITPLFIVISNESASIMDNSISDSDGLRTGYLLIYIMPLDPVNAFRSELVPGGTFSAGKYCLPRGVADRQSASPTRRNGIGLQQLSMSCSTRKRSSEPYCNPGQLRVSLLLFS